jgi:formiminotetrahydrofolate cyclodeaminase
MGESVGELSVQELLDSVGDRTTAPGGGAVAGVVAALAGALAGMCARFSGGDQADVARLADGLRARAVELAQADLAVYAAYVGARRAGRDDEVAAALDETIRVPLEMAEVAAELAELAEGLARSGNPNLRGDATAAVLMGAAAARAGAVLVCENLAGTASDPRLARAAAIVASVSAAERNVLSRYPALRTVDELPQPNGR